MCIRRSACARLPRPSVLLYKSGGDGRGLVWACPPCRVSHRAPNEGEEVGVIPARVAVRAAVRSSCHPGQRRLPRCKSRPSSRPATPDKCSTRGKAGPAAASPSRGQLCNTIRKPPEGAAHKPAMTQSSVFKVPVESNIPGVENNSAKALASALRAACPRGERDPLRPLPAEPVGEGGDAAMVTLDGDAVGHCEATRPPPLLAANANASANTRRPDGDNSQIALLWCLT